MKIYDDEDRIVPNLGAFKRGDEVPDDIAVQLQDAGLRVKPAKAAKVKEEDYVIRT